MPLTFAHPAVVLPFKYLPKKWYSWTGLIIGSIIPDFEAFIKLGGLKTLSHSWAGVLYFDLPVGLLFAFIFHAIIRDALIDQLPGFLYKRFCVLKGINWIRDFRQRYGAVLISLLVGIATHLVWDRLTHTDTYTYHQRIGIMIEPEQTAIIRQRLQWTSTFVGLILLFWQVMLLPAIRSVPGRPWGNFWILTACVALVIFALRSNFYYVQDDLINTAIAGILWGMIAASLILRIRTRGKLFSGRSSCIDTP